jgi:hypothetical protein
MRWARKLLHTQALAPYFDTDSLPGADVHTDEEWLDYARQYGSMAYHLIGTARMGPASDKTSVVDDGTHSRVAGRPGGRCLDHAEHAVGGYVYLDDDDRREGVRPDTWANAAAAGGGYCSLGVSENPPARWAT